MKKIILASTSPRRKEIFEKANIPFKIEASGFEENMTLNLEPIELAKYLSKGKALDVASKHKDAVVIGADTLISFEGKVLGKPQTRIKAKEMLKSLSGKSHSVFTGYTIIDCITSKTLTNVVETKIYFKKLSDEQIDDYIEAEKPFDRAGSYAIESLGKALVNKIQGDFSNVVGLPLSALASDLEQFGIACLVN